MERPRPILGIVAICGLVIVSRLAAQDAPNSASPKDEAQWTPAVLACPSTNEPLQDDVTFSWKLGSQTETATANVPIGSPISYIHNLPRPQQRDGMLKGCW